MKPVIALVGRPNVGKSTLFNRITRTRDALVADQPGMTRDRKYGTANFSDRDLIVIDTGGLSGENGIDELMADQTLQAIEEADVVIMMVDGREGLAGGDHIIAQRLRQMNKSVLLVMNKVDGRNADVISAEFYELGLGEPIALSAAHGRGVGVLAEALAALLPAEIPEELPPSQDIEKGTSIAIIGRPNVGKSTLVNRMLGEERVLVYDMPGTTRDSISIPFERRGKHYTLIDTAGVRRRGKVHEAIEKFSVIKSLQAISEANVTIVVFDAQLGISDQDLTLLGFALDQGRALVIAFNKWDGLEQDAKAAIKREMDRRLSFIDYAEIHFISALHGTGVGNLFTSVDKAYRSAMIQMQASRLTQILEDAVASHAPPLVRGRRIKLRFAHQGGQNPPIIVIHGNQTKDVPESYRRYLINTFRKVLNIHGTPIRIEFKSGDNPFKDRKNKLSPRQEHKRKRLKQHIRKHK